MQPNLTTITLALLALSGPALAQCETQKILPSTGFQFAEFGTVFGLDGDRCVTASWKDSETAQAAGSGHVFQLRNGAWVEEAKLLASDGATNDWFGVGADLSGTAAIFGAINDDDKGSNSGASYIYELVGSSWVETAKLVAPDGAAGDWNGFFVGISGTHALTTANKDDDKGSNSGSAYVYEQLAGSWTFAQKLTASDGAAGDEFGYSCCLDGTRLVLTSPNDDDNGSNSGSAYVFEKQAGLWVETAKLTASDGQASDNFGISVESDGDTIVLGAWGDDDRGNNAGSAYVFEKQGASWVETAKLLPTGLGAFDRFGVGAAVHAGYVVVGSKGDDQKGADAGAAYLFKQVGPLWVEVTKLVASDGAAADDFGFQVGTHAGVVVVSGHRDNDYAARSGSMYAFDATGLACPTLTSFNQLVSVSAGGAQLLALDAGAALGGDLYIVNGTVSGVSPGITFGAFTVPLNPDGYWNFTLANPNTPPLGNSLGFLDGAGQATATFTLPPGTDGSLAGIQAWHAFAVIDAFAGTLQHASNPVWVNLLP